MAEQGDRPTPFIHVRLQENRTPTGRRTSTPARQAALYYAYGRRREDRLAGRQRGEWLKPDGTVTDHEEVVAWIRAEAPQHRYTFQGLLSVPEGALPGSAFCQALRRGGQIGDGWRLITHTDTQNRHAHVLWFGDERLKKAHFLAWQQAVRAALAALVKQYPAVDLAAEQGVTERALGRRLGRGQEASFG